MANTPATASGSPTPPAYPAPGSPRDWHEGIGIYSGVVNVASGNAQIVLPICSWSGRGGGLQFALVFNSQSSQTSPLGPKWTHSYRWQVVAGTGQAVVIADDGTETLYTLQSGVYAPPAGVYDSLAAVNGGWLLTRKGGTQYAFNSSGFLVSVTDRYGNQTTLTYNTDGTLNVLTDAASRTLTFGYSTGGLLQSITQFNAAYVPVRVWNLAYDASNRLQVVADPLLQNQTIPYTRTIGYDANNNVAALTDRRNKTWTYSYNGTVFLTQTDPDYLAYVWTLAYAASSLVPNTSLVATWTNPRSAVVSYYLDGGGRALSIADAYSQQTLYAYDAANNLLSRQSPLGAFEQWGYNNRGNATTLIDAFNNTTMQHFDAWDNLIEVDAPLGRVTKYNYDSNGVTLLSVQDASGNLVTNVYNTDGSLQTTTDQEGRVTDYGYDQWGHIDSITAHLANFHTNSVQVGASQPGGISTVCVTNFVYYADSRMQQRTDATGRVTNYGYDYQGRLLTIAYPTGAGRNVTLAYDEESRLTQSIDGTGTRNYQYDAWGRKTQATDPMASSPMAASYDSEGNLLTQQDVTGRTHTYTHDLNNSLLTVIDNSGDFATATQYVYDNDGALSSIAPPNGTFAQWNLTHGRPTGLTWKRTADNSVLMAQNTAVYDVASRLRSLKDVLTTPGAAFTFGYDLLDNLTSEARSSAGDAHPYSGAYTYDKTSLRATAQRITNGATIHKGAYTYDKAGRLKTMQGTAPDPAGTESYGWNCDGTLASYPYNGQSALPVYDEEGRMISLSFSNGSATTLAFEYGYGYDGKRRWKKDYAAGTATWYPCGVACGAGELVELGNTIDASGNLLGQWQTNALYVMGLNVIYRKNLGANGTTLAPFEFHHYDFFGVAALITSQLTGGNVNVLSRRLYDRFGVLRYLQDSTGTYQAESLSHALGITTAVGIASPYGYGKADDGGLLQNAGCGEFLEARNLRAVPPPQSKRPDPLRNCSHLKGLQRCQCNCDNTQTLEQQLVESVRQDWMREKTKDKKDALARLLVELYFEVAQDYEDCMQRCNYVYQV